ncbi:hypothetical protein HYU18_03385 [Candidatus Woesearchaeota archaeon]|nr:hypothetical protein [Candidatus Woesearchaeota archaeon]
MGCISVRLLKPQDAEVAGGIVGVAHSIFEDLGAYEGAAWISGDFIPSLKRRIELGEVVVGAEACGGLVGVYELPVFLRRGQVIENPGESWGWLATSVHGQGIGSALMERLAAVFGYAANVAHTEELIHTEQATNSMNKRFFVRNGYTVIDEKDRVRHVFYLCQRSFPASDGHQLSALEREIARAILEPSLQRQTI